MMSDSSNGDRTTEFAAQGPLKVSEPIADTARAAMTLLLSRHSPLQVAEMLGVHNTHVYVFRNDGRVSPTLQDALVDEGFIPSKKDHRRAAYFGSGREGEQLAAEWDKVAERWGGMTGLARGILEGKYRVLEKRNGKQ